MGIAVGAVCYIFNKIERKRKGIRYALIPGVLAFLLWVIIKMIMPYYDCLFRAFCYIFDRKKRKGIRRALIPGVLAFLLWVIIKVVENLIKLYM